jgi:DNA-binding MarR family transcriptional regulator
MRFTPKQAELLVGLYKTEKDYMESAGFHSRYPSQEVHRDEFRTAKSLEPKGFLELRGDEQDHLEATLTPAGRELGQKLSEKQEKVK